MKRMIVVGCALAVLSGTPGLARAQAQGSGATTGTQSTDRANAQRTDALAALQDARVTMARLTEASMSQDARNALARVSTNFRTLYKAYTGEEPTPNKTALQASGQPSADWEQSYDILESAVGRVLGRESAAAVGTTGNAPGGGAGTAAQAGSPYELTTPVRQDFQVLLQQLQRFHEVAGGKRKSDAAK